MKLAIALVAFTSAAVAADPVLLLSSRAGWIEAVSPDTLDTLSRVKTPRLTESVASSSDGTRLFIAAPPEQSTSCCALYSLDPLSMRLSPLIAPAQSVTITPGRVLVQRGNTGVDSFALATLGRLSTIKAPGVYRLRASADGRLAFGITNWPRPSLDLFDIAQGALVASHALPGDSAATGAWLRHSFYLFLGNRREATLQSVNDHGEFGPAMPMSFRISGRPCPYDTAASSGKLILYSGFGLKSDDVCDAPGGFVAVDPADGAATAQLDRELHFRQLVSIGSDGFLYGLDVGVPSWSRVRVVKIDAATGAVMREKLLDGNVWNMNAGSLPDAMRGRLDLTAVLPGQ
jgi:hypothetical protein